MGVGVWCDLCGNGGAGEGTSTGQGGFQLDRSRFALERLSVPSFLFGSGRGYGRKEIRVSNLPFVPDCLYNEGVSGISDVAV